MHIVLMEVLVMIMNCFQSKLEIRMQSMQSPANEKPSPGHLQTQRYFCQLLRIRIKPQQLLLPMMSETCLGGKRLSVWMKRSWTSSGSNTSRGTASKTCVARCTSNRPRGSSLLYNKAQHAILRAIIHNNPTSLASTSAWKVLVLSSWPFLGRPAVNASESSCAHFLDARLELFWAEDWSALWATIRAECGIAPPYHTPKDATTQ